VHVPLSTLGLAVKPNPKPTVLIQSTYFSSFPMSFKGVSDLELFIGYFVLPGRSHQN
jgi:hypothetical protein